MSVKAPDRLFIDENDRPLYESLKKMEFFKGKDAKDLFLMAAIYGFKNGTKKPLDKKWGYFRAEYLSREDWALLNSMAFSEKSIDVIGDSETVFRIAEEYAHYGISLLSGETESGSPGSYEKKLEVEVALLLKDIAE